MFVKNTDRSENTTNKKVKRDDKWYVYSEDGKKKLGGPYDTEKEADERLKEVEYFKHKKNQLVTMKTTITPMIRNDRMEDKDYLVVPMVMLVEGVHNGSCGALYYPADELEKTPQAWNCKPVVVYHPEGPTACDPDILTNRAIGKIMNTKWEDGKLKAEAWLDADRMKKVDQRVADAIENQQMLELSTGLFTDTEGPSGQWQDEDYDAIARNYRPDHLAVLPDQIGACSTRDGAGFIRNVEEVEHVILIDNRIDVTESFIRIRQKEPSIFDDSTFRTIWLSKEKGIKAIVGRLKNPAKGQEGSAVVQSILFDKEKWSKTDAKKWAKEHDAKSNVADIQNELSHNDIWGQLSTIIQKQSINEDNILKIWYYVVEVFSDYFIYEAAGKLYRHMYEVKDDIVRLSGIPEEVVRVVTYKTVNTNNVVTEKDNTMKKEEMIAKLVGNKDSGWTDADKEILNSMTEDQLKALIAKVPEKKNQEPEKKIENKEPEKKIENQEPEKKVENKEPEKKETPKPITADEFIKAAPAEIQNVLSEGLRAFNSEKNSLIDVITKNPNCAFTKEFLATKNLDELRGLAKLSGAPEKKPENVPMFNYSGQGEPIRINTDNVKLLDLPVMNFDEK